MAFWQLVLLAAPCLVGALPTAGPARRGLPALPPAHRAARHRLSALPLPSVDELTSLSTAIGSIGGGGAHVPHVLDGIASTLSTLSTLTVADNPSVNPIAFIEQGERNVGIGFMQQVCSGLTIAYPFSGPARRQACAIVTAAAAAATAAAAADTTTSTTITSKPPPPPPPSSTLQNFIINTTVSYHPPPPSLLH